MAFTGFENRLNGRCVLITGGAGGLGAPSARALAKLGAKVIVLDRDAETSAALVQEVNSADGDGEVEQLNEDLSNPDRVASRVRELANHQPIDILINNAAIYPSKSALEYSIEEFEQVQRVNVTAAFACCQAVLPNMIAREWGRIINVSSITFYGGWEKLAPYVVSKGSLIALTRAIAREYGPHGITSNAICPGAFKTAAEDIHGDPEAYAHFVLNHQSIKRRGTPDDFIAATVFFCSEAAGFITGQSLNVDGGWFMQ